MTALFVAFQGQPWLAVLPAILFAGLGCLSRIRLVLATAVLWLLYCGYELAVEARILCSGECNIRVDLLILAPLLISLSALSGLAFARWAFRRAASSGA